jgi:hypothetical protein
VARHRRPVAVATPVELLMFDPADWLGREGFVPGSNGLEWDSSVERWKAARRAFARQHPDSELGSVLAQMRFERRVQDDL